MALATVRGYRSSAWIILLAAEIALEVAAHTLDVECLQLLGAGAQVQRFNGTEFEEHV